MADEQQVPIPVSFSKDSDNNFNTQQDTVEGRVYFRKDGIYVDGDLYANVGGTNTGIATTSSYGSVQLADTMETGINQETGQEYIIAPSGQGIAASPTLVLNALATAKNYVDAAIQGIPAGSGGIVAKIEDNQGNVTNYGNEVIFSNDFEKTDNRLYIKWLEIS